jgi:ATP-dependent DNA helicase UvrD/PcrA
MLEGLNSPQRQAVSHSGGPLLVIAGAGSGKTRVLTTRIAWLIREQRVPPESVLAFTFTNKAAREMRDRVDRMVPEAQGRCWIGTFHATGVRILRNDGHRLGYDRFFTIYDADDSRSLLKKIAQDFKLESKQYSPRMLSTEISAHKNHFRSPEQVLTQAVTPREEKIAEVYAEYVQRLKANGAMDFDDLIAKTVELFEEHRDIQQRYSQRFEHVLVDEFQDTNPLQLVMVRALCAQHDNLCAVGDDDQSIYSWRGATVENMLGFEEYFPGSTLVRLEQNYRSTSLILGAANSVIANNRHRKGKTLWSERDGGVPIELWWTEDEHDEGRRIRDRISRLLGETDARRRDMVVLYRTNAQSRAVEDALRREAIPYQIVGGTRFYERREVRDLLAYLKCVANPADSVSLARVLNVPKRGIGKTSAERFFELSARSGSLVGALSDRAQLLTACGKAAAGRLSNFGGLLSTLRRLAENADAASVLRQVLQSTKYENYLREDDPSTADDRLANVYELLNAAEEFSSESDEPGLGPFLESVALLAEVDKMTDETDLVTLMTVHNAKGLEFPYVFIAGCEEGLMPHASSIEDDDQLEEERRLFYVALTRAEEAVFLTAAATRRKFGSSESTLASRFVGEIPAEMVVEMGSLAFGERSWSPSGSRGHSRSPRNFGLPSADRGPRPPRNRDAGVSADALADAQAFLRSRAKSKSQIDRGSTHGFDDHDLSQEERSYQVGMRVEHELLGVGVIEELEGSGDLLRLTLRFGDRGRKRILARYARLRALDTEAGAQ